MQKEKKVDSVHLFNPVWISWKIGGAALQPVKYPRLYSLFSVIVFVAIIVAFPTHFLLALFSFDQMEENMKNLVIGVTISASATKFIMNVRNFEKIIQFQNILKELDSRVSGAAERKQFEETLRSGRNIVTSFLLCYAMIAIMAVATVVFSSERTLIHPAWFPYDWNKNLISFHLTNLYQMIGLCFHLTINFGNDLVPSTSLCILSGHLKLLWLRIASIGRNSESTAENEKEMIDCIRDQKNLYDLFDVVEAIISWPMLLQFLVTAANVCVATGAMLFFAEAPASKFYYFFYSFGILLQIFPVCYYGSDIHDGHDKLPYALFCSNWIDQSPAFKKNMIIFLERSLRSKTIKACGVVNIHLDTFFSTIQAAYSLFSVILGNR